MLTRIRNGVVVAVALTAAAIAAAPSQGQSPQAAPDLSAAALAKRLELVRQEYTSHDYAGARQELWALVDLVRAADQSASVRSEPAARGRLPRAGQDVPMPSRIEVTQPEYPIGAAKKGVIGYVVIDFVIAKSGKPRNFSIAHSIPALDHAALDAVRRWRYAKPEVGGAAADIAATAVLPFFLRRETPATDELDLARLFVERADYAAAEAPISRALAVVSGEATCSQPALRVVTGELGLEPGFQPPRLIAEVKPSYTRVALDAKVTGVVHLEGVVELDGRPVCLRVLQSVPLLDQQAIDAVSRWRFEPATVDAKPIRLVIRMDVSFAIK